MLPSALAGRALKVVMEAVPYHKLLSSLRTAHLHISRQERKTVNPKKISRKSLSPIDIEVP